MLLAVPRFMDSTKGSKVRTFESNFRTLMSMANQYSANNAGVFTKINDASSDVAKLAGQLKDKPDNSVYTVSETAIVATLDLQKANVSNEQGTYKLTYTYSSGEEANSAILFYRKFREVISYHLSLEADEFFDGQTKLDESYFGGPL